METKFLVTKILLLFMFLSGTTALAQSDIAADTKINMPHNWGKKPGENVPQYVKDSKIPQYLLEQYKHAKLTGNQDEKIRVGLEMEKYTEASHRPPEGSYEKTTVITKPPAPFSPDWYNNDVLVLNGDVKDAGGFRMLDLKTGEDGWLYLAVNRRNVPGSNGCVTIYRSSNGGVNWSVVASAQNGVAYFGTISMIVEKRHATIDDSVRIMVFYTRSNSSNFDNAALEVFSIRKNGTAAFVDLFASPSSGNKFEYVTSCSDGVYYDVATYMHVIVRECTNSGVQFGLRHWISYNWCTSFSGVMINTSNPDYYPSAAYSDKPGIDDSIYIAVERRNNSNEYEIRAIITGEIPSTASYCYFITSAGSGIKYERPCITVQQQHENLPRRVLITYTRNNLARYCRSVNGGQTWTVDVVLGSNGLADYTWCNSDSLTSGDGYAVACYVNQAGDSITVRRGNMTGSLGTFFYKVNSVNASGVLVPVCAVYKVGTSKWAAMAYAGYGPQNVYFDSEQLITGIKQIGNTVPGRYELSQNYPNPFNPVTNINFSIPKAGQVKLVVFDIAGREAAVLVNEELSPGSYVVDFDASKLASGVYLYKLTTEEFSDVKKMILVK